MKDLCPHCYKDMELDTDFMVQRNMFADDETGEFNCPHCDEKVYWKSYHTVNRDFEKDPDYL